MYKFQTLYSSVTRNIRFAGILLLPDSIDDVISKKYSKLFTVYSVLSAIPLIFAAVCCFIYLIISADGNITRAIAGLIGTMVAVLYNVYFLLQSNSVHMLLESLNRVTKVLIENDLFTTNKTNYILRNSLILNGIAKYVMLSQYLVAVGFCVYIFVQHSIFQSYEFTFPIPYDIHSFAGIYIFTVFAHNLTAVYGVAKQGSTQCLIFCLILHLVFCLKQLRFSSERVFQDDIINDTRLLNCSTLQKQVNFKEWIRMYDEIIQ